MTTPFLPSPLTFERWIYLLRFCTTKPNALRIALERMPEALPPKELAFFKWMCESTAMSESDVLSTADTYPGWVRSMRRYYLVDVPSQKPAFETLEQWIEVERTAWASANKSVVHWLETCETVEPGCLSTAMLPRYIPKHEIELVLYAAKSGKCEPREVLQKFFQNPANLRSARAIKEIGDFHRAHNEEPEERTELVTLRVNSRVVSVLRSAAQMLDVSFDEFAAGALRQEAGRRAQL